ncbi:serine/threonine-protein kinase [Varibaculum vaginae]|uniref:serine/threonine-protein kinase n=1 Tax=Varibaculum vaginae TaxID=2364797 RepID=UPI000F090010|nr:serine/threonine-protein kinase [Varibaculum vaginae]
MVPQYPEYPDRFPRQLGNGEDSRFSQVPVANQGVTVPPQTPFYLAGYRLLKALGSGTMGEVWQVADPGGNVYAAKILRSKLAIKPGIVQRFRMEKDLVTAIRHQNIVEVYDLVQTPEYMAIIMEYTDSGDLGELLKKRGTLLPLDAVYYCMGIAAGLSPIHQAGIVHRDLKPSNILLKRQGNYLVPKIADFGLARWIDPRYEIQTTKRSGTPYYMAPEMIEGKGVSSKTDIYSLGVILYELLCGITPFRGTVGEVLNQQFYDMPGMLTGISSSLWNVITKMLAKETSVRPDAAQTYALLKSVVEQVRNLEALEVLTEPPPPQPLEEVVRISPPDAQTSLASAKPIIPAHDEAETRSGQTVQGQVEPGFPTWHPVSLPPAIMVNTEETIGVTTGSPEGFSSPREQKISPSEQTIGAWGNSPDLAENLSNPSFYQGPSALRRSPAKEILGGIAIGLGIGTLITLLVAAILLLF